MKQLSDSKIYEQELQYWPYIKSWKKVLNYLVKNTPRNGTLIDIMCGPGYLLGKIAQKRKDLSLYGVDIDKRYISFSKKKYPKINFTIGNVLTYKSKQLYDVVICTGSLHHVPYEKQDKAVKNMASMVKQNGFCLISDCLMDDYDNEKQRKISAAKLGYEYLRKTIQNGAPDNVVEATIDILYNDVMMHEYKTSLKKRMPVYKKYFSKVQTIKVWPKTKTKYGDYIMICKK
ncbi:class I SAM-dependent methyltransferase [Candidatus Falkowbacteria bacterium]|nr:class I SAM-dependent methyltransferase [Candidatus Falkowbacteria bacterium]